MALRKGDERRGDAHGAPEIPRGNGCHAWQPFPRGISGAPWDIMVQVNDSLDASRLERLGIGVRGHAPYTLSTRVLYRQLPEMKRAGLLYWGKNSPQPIHRPDVRDSWPVKPAEPTRDGTPWLPTPPPRPMVVDGVSSTQTVTIWSEGFETNQVPGTYWSTGDLNPNTGHDY